MITNIPLSKLEISPQNARKSFSKSGIEEMQASILAHGLMQNLIVTKADKGKHYVVAGGRRLTAMKALQKSGKLAKDYDVACQVKDDDQVAELSLAENVVREAMHPADEFLAFAKLAETGVKASDIATRFGVSEDHVKKRLKLGSLAPEILQAYRDEKIDLKCAMAFTLTDDHNAQKKALKAEGSHPNAYSIKQLLTKTKQNTRTGLGSFVGEKAYLKAGGTITADLFGEDKFFDDATLVKQLAQDKLKAQADALIAEGWGWTEIAIEFNHSTIYEFGRIEPKPLNAPKKLIDKQAKLKAAFEVIDKQWDEINQGDDEEACERIDAKRDEAQEALDEVETELDKFSAFDPEEMKHAGAYVGVGYDGKVRIELGLVRKKDMKHVSASGDEDADDDEQEEEKPKEKGMSQSLIDSLKRYRLDVSTLAIASNPEIAFDLMVFKAASGLVNHHSVYRGADISFRPHTSLYGEKETFSPACRALHDLKSQLSLEWSEKDSEEDRFTEFCKLPIPAKHAILAYCTAVTLQAQFAPKPDSAGDRIICAHDVSFALTGVQVEVYWRPTADNFLLKITTEQLLKLGAEIFSESWAAKWKSAKKKDIIAELDRAFADPSKFSGNKETEQKLRTWLPEGMAFTQFEPKPTKAKKKAA